MFKITYNEAMVIQRSQMVYYRNLIGRAGVKAIKEKTFCPKDINPNKPMPVSHINQFVPRGGDFEYLINYHGQKSCPNVSAWHDAIRKGFF